MSSTDFKMFLSKIKPIFFLLMRVKITAVKKGCLRLSISQMTQTLHAGSGVRVFIVLFPFPPWLGKHTSSVLLMVSCDSSLQNLLFCVKGLAHVINRIYLLY